VIFDKKERGNEQTKPKKKRRGGKKEVIRATQKKKKRTGAADGREENFTAGIVGNGRDLGEEEKTGRGEGE